ncbi:protein of unknown function [Burkholderia multivorans]
MHRKFVVPASPVELALAVPGHNICAYTEFKPGTTTHSMESSNRLTEPDCRTRLRGVRRMNIIISRCHTQYPQGFKFIK